MSDSSAAYSRKRERCDSRDDRNVHYECRRAKSRFSEEPRARSSQNASVYECGEEQRRVDLRNRDYQERCNDSSFATRGNTSRLSAKSRKSPSRERMISNQLLAEDLDAGHNRGIQDGSQSKNLESAVNVDIEQSNEPFVWRKRDKMLEKQGIAVSSEYQARKRANMAMELERAKMRREERQRERDSVETERARVARMREQELNADWDRMEDSFHGQQHFLRQAIRLREKRPTLADQMARNIRLDLPEVQPDPRSPAQILNDMKPELSYEILRDLRENIQLELDYIPDFPSDDDTDAFNTAVRSEWWRSVDIVICDMMRWTEAISVTDADYDQSKISGQVRGKSGVHPSIQGDLEAMLTGKALEDLVAMERDVAPRIEGGVSDDGTGADEDQFAEVDFWQAALGRIRREVAIHRLNELNALLARERRDLLAALPQDLSNNEDTRAGLDGDEGPTDMNEEAMVRAEASKGMKINEEIFDDVVREPSRRVSHNNYAWNDKYRPRRPRFFNRVHTGYDWNKYNRTHYDHDNPPPKTVQGYKFNIFYPDLIDRSKAPTFTVTRTENPEVCILTFKAGPPYEDLAFKIVNRPWEHSHRRGFRCTFDRGILHLWFNFRRLRYRR